MQIEHVPTIQDPNSKYIKTIMISKLWRLQPIMNNQLCRKVTSNSVQTVTIKICNSISIMYLKFLIRKYVQKEIEGVNTFFSASIIVWKLLTARCNALIVWFLCQNDANLYLTLPAEVK
jgi:hypothetical protein